jgi:hypothetical protein
VPARSRFLTQNATFTETSDDGATLAVMKPAYATTYTLERCAHAAGFAAVSSLDEDRVRQWRRPRRYAGISLWRAALALVLILA